MHSFLSTHTPFESSFYRVPRFAGHLIGIWPGKRRAGYIYPLFAVSVFFVAFGAIGECLYGFKYVTVNSVSALEAFCPALTKMSSVLKMFVFFIDRRKWHTKVERLRLMIVKSKSARQDIERFLAIGNRLSFMLFTIGIATVVAFTVQPLISYALNMWQGLPSELTDLPFNAALPDFMLHYPYYPVSYALLAASGTSTVCVFTFVDGFFLCSCLYVAGVFRMIQHDIRMAFTDLSASEETFSAAQNALIRARLIVIVERHNAIIDLCTELTAQFTVVVLIYFLPAALILCMSILDLMLNSASISALIYICYTIAVLVQLYIYCYGGSNVSESSAAVADTLYAMDWYKGDVKTRKMILMILRHSQKAKTIAVPFFTPSLSAYSSILSTAGSYITLLQTFL